jgi:hypothetical protein
MLRSRSVARRCASVLAFAAQALVLVTASVWAQSEATRKAGPTRPAPRWPDGLINFGAPLDETGVWEGQEPLATDPNHYEARNGGRLRPSRVHIDDVPLQPWARAILKTRHDRSLADEPYTRCKPSPGPRSLGTAYGVEVLNLPGSTQYYLFVIGGPHTFRVIYMDGRGHPARPDPTYFGHSIGWWEGDTLVIDTVGFNEAAWMDRSAMPHTDRLHTVERLTRRDFDTLDYTVTFDDPGAYTAPWTSGYTKRWEKGTELFEYICQGNNYAPQLMIGASGEERGASAIVP